MDAATNDAKVVDLKSNSGGARSRRQKPRRHAREASSGYKLHLVFDRDSYARLLDLKDALRAASTGELIRRALQAYEVFEPENEGTESQNPAPLSKGETDVEHVYIQVPAWVKVYLDKEKSVSGKTYADTVRQSLRVLAQLVKAREKLLTKVSEGESKDETRAMGYNTENDLRDLQALVI